MTDDFENVIGIPEQVGEVTTEDRDAVSVVTKRRERGDHRGKHVAVVLGELLPRTAEPENQFPFHVPLGKADRAGDLQVDRPPWLDRTLAHWGTLSPFARIDPVAVGASAR